MITQMTGIINRVLDEEVRLQIGPFEYAVLIPEFLRRQLQTRLGKEVTLHISEYIEGGPNSNKFLPRKIGFLREDEMEFFDLFCTVEKIGPKKGLKALARPIREIADAISRQDAKWLTTLPGVGAATAEQIVTTLKRKVTRFALTREARQADDPSEADTPSTVVNAAILEDAYNALLVLGMSPLDARAKLDQVLESKAPIASVQEIIGIIFKK